MTTTKDLTVGITITFDRRKYYLPDDKITQLAFTRSDIAVVMNECDVKYELYVEYTKKGLIHYHGVIYYKRHEQSRKVIKECYEKFGYVKLRSIYNAEKWLCYCMKEQNQLKITNIEPAESSLSEQ